MDNEELKDVLHKYDKELKNTYREESKRTNPQKALKKTIRAILVHAKMAGLISVDLNELDEEETYQIIVMALTHIVLDYDMNVGTLFDEELTEIIANNRRNANKLIILTTNQDEVAIKKMSISETKRTIIDDCYRLIISVWGKNSPLLSSSVFYEYIRNAFQIKYGEKFVKAVSGGWNRLIENGGDDYVFYLAHQSEIFSSNAGSGMMEIISEQNKRIDEQNKIFDDKIKIIDKLIHDLSEMKK